MGYSGGMPSTTDNFGNLPPSTCLPRSRWTKQRILFLLGGSFTITGTTLAVVVNRWLALIPALVGANQLLMVAVGWCPMSKLLDRILPAPST